MSQYYEGPYGISPYGHPPYPVPREHPQGTLILVLGLVSLAFSPLGFVAWYLGSKTEKEIEYSGVPYSNTGNVRIGKIIGMVMGILTIVSVALTIVYMIAMLLFFGGIFASIMHS